jgi:Icc-related predicted phosphoesterase
MPSVKNHSEIIKPVDMTHRDNKLVHKCTPSVFMTEYDYGNSFHSVTFGQVHVIFLNSYTSSNPASRQYRWVESELHSLDRIKVPWIIVVMHCPFYNTFASHQHEKQEEQMKQHLEPLFVRFEVNIVVAGHTHAYR